jgi:hypothetical protein
MGSIRLEWTIEARPAEVQAALWGLCRVAFVQLSESPYPSLYTSGVRYRREPFGQERWLGPRDVLRLGYGDCEDLVAWRVGELWLQRGMQAAEPRCYAPMPGLIHCVVRTPRGMEDPSRQLGMSPASKG